MMMMVMVMVMMMMMMMMIDEDEMARIELQQETDGNTGDNDKHEGISFFKTFQQSRGTGGNSVLTTST